MLKALFRHSFWNAVATFSYQGSTFVSNFLVIKLLDHTEYGKVSLINFTAFYAANILQFGVGSTVSRFVARYLDDQTRMSAVLWFCGIFSLVSGFVGLFVLASTAGFVANHIFTEPTLAWPLAIASLSVPGLVGAIYFNGLLQGLHGFRALALSSAISGILFIGIVAAGAWTGSLTGAVLGFVCGAVVRSGILAAAAFVVLRDKWRSSRQDVIGEWKRGEIRGFQVPAGLAGFLTLPTLWLMPTILAHETQNFADVGSYSVILMLKSIVILPAWVVALALQPSLERASASNLPQTATRIFHTALAVSATIVIILATFVLIFAGDLMMAFGKGFAVESAELQLMMIAAIAEGFALTFYMRIQMAGRMWSVIFAALLPRDAVMLVIVVVMAPHYGLRGAIVAHSVGAIVNLAGAYWLSVRSVRGLRPVGVN